MVAKRFRIGLAVAISAVFAAQLAVMPVTYAAASVATQAATQSAAQSGTPKFTESACQFDTTNQGLSGMTEGTDYRCGMVTVPEDHTKADNGKTIQIAVAVFKSTAATPAADPRRVSSHDRPSKVRPALGTKFRHLFRSTRHGLFQTAAVV